MKHVKEKSTVRGRGVSANPENRFTDKSIKFDPDSDTGLYPSKNTAFITDHSESIISSNKSPDIPFEFSLNPYRGCEHGCVYCYARPTHEFLGYSAGLDFETKIIVKRDAPRLLKKTLAKKSWKPQTLVMSGVTDPYQPVEKELEITRGCIHVLADCLHPLGIITKNHLITRDIDLLIKLAEVDAVHVTISITTLRNDLAGVMEPRTSRPERRLDAIRRLSEAGISVGVNIAPVIPGLTDDEMVKIMEKSKEAGAVCAGYQLLRLPYGVKDLFLEWLEYHFPNRKSKVINKILDIREGKLNKSEFGERFSGTGEYAAQIRRLFQIHYDRLGFTKRKKSCNRTSFKRPETGQLSLFSE